jgi:DNA-binding MarR family transcriptional regulator
MSTEIQLEPVLDFMRGLWHLSHALELTSSAMQRKLAITAPQRMVLRCVGAQPGLAAGQLARMLHLDPGTVSAALRRLEKKDLLERRRDPADGRRVAISLTRAGLALTRPARGTVEAAVARLLRRGSWRARQASNIIAELTELLEREATGGKRSKR